MKIRCWVLGCPVIEEVTCEDDEHCKHCGRFRVDFYGESIGFFVLDPIYKRIYEKLHDLFFRVKSIVYPEKCWQCGKRYKHNEAIEHLPF